MGDVDTEEHPVFIFDGVCNFCAGNVDFYIARDSEKWLRFAAAQSEAGRTLLEEYGVPFDPEDPEASVLIDGDTFYTGSDAVLRACKYLDWPWSLLRFLRVFPRFVRSLVYDWVDRNRYKWFGKKDACMTPTRDIKDRFLETD